jgi:hypothetical protein
VDQLAGSLSTLVKNINVCLFLFALSTGALGNPLILTTPIAVSSYGDFGYSLGDQYADISGSGSNDMGDYVSFRFNGVPYGPAAAIKNVNANPYTLGSGTIDGIYGLAMISLDFSGDVGSLSVYSQGLLAATAPIYTFLSGSSSSPIYAGGRLVEVDYGVFTTSTTPEPSSLYCVGLGVLAVSILRATRKGGTKTGTSLE